MSGTPTVRLETDGRGVARITLAHAARHNALGAGTIAELSRIATRLGMQEGLRAAVLAAEGESFCAGGDLGWMRAQMEGDRAARIAEARRLAEMLGALDRLPCPLIARVQGPAYGGGLGLVAVCDIAIAADGARFALTETRLGLIPATIAPYVIARMGPRAREVFLTPRRIGAEEAARLGLVARAVPPEELDAAVEAEIATALEAAPGAVAAAKALHRRLASRMDGDTIAATVEALADRWESPEAAEGVAAFFEKRPPAWMRGQGGPSR